MASYEIKSKNTDDVIIIKISDDRMANIVLDKLEKVSIHLELLGNALKFVKGQHIKRVQLSVDGKYDLPPEGEYKISKDGLDTMISCDVSHFDSLYRKNLQNLISEQNVVFPFEKVDKDGWVTAVKDKKKAKRKCMSELKEEIGLLGMSWGE